MPVSIVPEDWHDAAVGGSVIGSRSAVFAPVSNLSAILVFDEHDSSYQGERAPTWNARDVAIERAKREQIPCVLTSAIPTLEAISWGHQVKPSRKEERDGWPVVEIIDRKGEGENLIIHKFEKENIILIYLNIKKTRCISTAGLIFKV